MRYKMCDARVHSGTPWAADSLKEMLVQKKIPPLRYGFIVDGWRSSLVSTVWVGKTSRGMIRSFNKKKKFKKMSGEVGEETLNRP